MGAQAKASNFSNSLQRVKVYRLNNDGKWDDQGTGHVALDYLERSEVLGLLVVGEEDNDTLLKHLICADDIYKRQEDTIISWREPESSIEMALSFQEATGCSYIWDHISEARRTMDFNSLGSLDVARTPSVDSIEASGSLQSNDDPFHAMGREFRDLPSVELSTLPLILKTVVDCSVTDQMRGIELMLHNQEFFPKLMDLFRMCEDLEDMDSLHMIYRLIKGIILLNSPQIFEKILGEEYILDVIGSLEYDPDVPEVQHHRSFLKENVVFKEVIPIKDPAVLSKIHQTYRVGYIKDVILPRVLDEATIASLNSIIHGNNAIVISMLKDDISFIRELFARMRSNSTSSESKRDMALFLHEFCSLSKSLPLVQQLRLLRDLASEGIFDIITEMFQSEDRQQLSTGTDILILFLNQDPNLLRSFVVQQEGNSLLRLLVKGMITDFGEDMHCQFLEIIRILVDSYTMSGSQRDTVVEIFYEKHLDQIIDVIASSCPRSRSQTILNSSERDGRNGSPSSTKPEILTNICELLCFCVVHHPYGIKCNFLMNNAIEKVLYLTRRREQYLVVAAVRFMRTIISRNDEHLLRHIIKNNLLKPIIEVFVENGNRYNMLQSGVLNLFEHLRKDNIKSMIIYTITNFWDQLLEFEHLSTIQSLKIKYEQLLENSETKNTFDATEPRKRVDERGLEKEEEDYFNEDSDEEDSASAQLPDSQKRRASPRLPNGTKVSYSPLRVASQGLVDYEDDEDDEDYNPPSKKPEPSSSLCEKASKPSKKTKRISSGNDDEEPELIKKQKLNDHSTASKVVVVTAFSTCNKNEVPSNDAKEEPENTNITKETEPQESFANVSDTSDTRQMDREEPSVPINSQELSVNSTNIAGPEPYPVR